MYICPVCKSNNVTIHGLGDTAHSAKCEACGTYDAIHRFQVIEQKADAAFDPTMIFPPDDIIACAEKLHRYFTVERRAKQWAFGHVQSRDEPALIGIEHVRNMAAAFRMELIARPKYVDLVEKVREWLKTADAEAKEANEPVHMQAEAVAHSIDNHFFNAEPF